MRANLQVLLLTALLVTFSACSPRAGRLFGRKATKNDTAVAETARPSMKEKKGAAADTLSAKPTDKKRGKALGIVPPDSAKTGVAVADTVKKDSTQAIISDSVSRASRKTAIVDSLKLKGDLKSSVVYKAQDSIIFDIEKKMLLLYGDVEVSYAAEKIELKAAQVQISYETQTVFANGVADSTGKLTGTPEFSQDQQQFEAQRMSYNFKSGKARTFGARTEQNGDYILADTVKRFKDGIIYGKSGKFTTCNHPYPHFYIQAQKMKLTDNQIISGPLNIVIAGLPLPIVIPFAFFPKTDQKQNGILLPQYGNADGRGFFLRNLGYYWGINDRMDAIFDGDIFTNGSFRIGAKTNYNYKYRFSGNMSFSYTLNRFGEKGDRNVPSPSRGFQWIWIHNQPINPTTRLNASVNIAATSYLRGYSLNQNDVLQNNLMSSVSFSKTFPNMPAQPQLNVRLGHQQDVNKGTMTATLPDVSFSLNRMQPFRQFAGSKWLGWLGNLGGSYSFLGRNNLLSIANKDFLVPFLDPLRKVNVPTNIRVTDGVADTIFNTLRAYRLLQNGISHNIPIGTTIKLGSYVNIPVNFNFNEYWYFKTERRVYDPNTKQIVIGQTPGFARASDYNFSTNVNVNMFGIYQLTRTKRQIAFRQRMSPRVGFSYKPDFLKNPNYFGTVRDSTGKPQTYSYLTTGLGAPSGGESRSLTFGLDNALEMKIRTKESFTSDFDEKKDRFKRINLLNLNLNGGYNFAADSFQLSTMSASTFTSLFNNKLKINANASFDPYAVNDAGDRIQTFEWDASRNPARMTSAGINLTTSLQPQKSKDSPKPAGQQTQIDSLERASILNGNPQRYVDFSVPWSMNLTYNFNYTKTTTAKAALSQVVNIQGDVSFTPKWKVTYATGYNIITRKATATNLGIYRDLHCWALAFTFTPFGPLQYYLLSVSVKSPTLQDLRLQKRDQWQDRR